MEPTRHEHCRLSAETLQETIEHDLVPRASADQHQQLVDMLEVIFERSFTSIVEHACGQASHTVDLLRIETAAPRTVAQLLQFLGQQIHVPLFDHNRSCRNATLALSKHTL
jgi:hypothetical protein